jgi:hypothetical protein
MAANMAAINYKIPYNFCFLNFYFKILYKIVLIAQWHIKYGLFMIQSRKNDNYMSNVKIIHEWQCRGKDTAIYKSYYEYGSTGGTLRFKARDLIFKCDTSISCPKTFELSNFKNSSRNDRIIDLTWPSVHNSCKI